MLFLYLSTGSIFNISKISSFHFWSERVYPAALVNNFASNEVNYFYPLL